MNNLTNLRLRKGVSIQQLSKIVGVSESTMQRYENEIYQLPQDVLRKLADYFVTTPEHIVLHTSSYHSERITIPLSLLVTLLPETCIIDVNNDDNENLFHGTPNELPDTLKRHLCLLIRSDKRNHMTITITAK